MKPYTIILGATGSVGEKAIRLLKNTSKIKIIAVACNTNEEKLNQIKKEINCEFTYCKKKSQQSLEDFLKQIVEIYSYRKISCLNAISGFDGLEASILLAKYKITTLMANKESIICGGSLLLSYYKKNKTKIIPVDSEHSAIYTLINNFKDIKKVIITASGGVFRDYQNFEGIKPCDAISNPNWKMGAKISVDSSTLANKLMEIIEACILFKLKKSQVEVVLHRESYIHSLIEIKNNVLYAEIYKPDMIIPIAKAYSLNSPNEESTLNGVKMSFEEIDTKRFPFINLADELVKSHKKTIIFNAANEIAVSYFIKDKIKYIDIYKVVQNAIQNSNKISKTKKISTFDDIYELDKITRQFVIKYIEDYIFDATSHAS